MAAKGKGDAALAEANKAEIVKALKFGRSNPVNYAVCFGNDMMDAAFIADKKVAPLQLMLRARKLAKTDNAAAGTMTVEDKTVTITVIKKAPQGLELRLKKLFAFHKKPVSEVILAGVIASDETATQSAWGEGFDEDIDADAGEAGGAPEPQQAPAAQARDGDGDKDDEDARAQAPDPALARRFALLQRNAHEVLTHLMLDAGNRPTPEMMTLHRTAAREGADDPEAGLSILKTLLPLLKEALERKSSSDAIKDWAGLEADLDKLRKTMRQVLSSNLEPARKTEIGRLYKALRKRVDGVGDTDPKSVGASERRKMKSDLRKASKLHSKLKQLLAQAREDIEARRTEAAAI